MDLRVRELVLEWKKDRKPARPAKEAFVAVVRCKRFQCLALRDADGIWRDLDTNEPLPDFEQVMFPLL